MLDTDTRHRNSEIYYGYEIPLCVSCDMAAHQVCYGLEGTLPDGDWFCRQCEAKVTPETCCCTSKILIIPFSVAKICTRRNEHISH